MCILLALDKSDIYILINELIQIVTRDRHVKWSVLKELKMLVQNPNFISIVEGVDFRHVGEQKVIGLDSFFIKTGQGYPFGRYGIEEANILKGLNVLFDHTGYISVDVEWLKEVRHSLRSFGFIIFGPDNNVVAYAQCSSNRLWRFRMCHTPEYHRCYTYTFPYKGAWLLENNSNDCLSAIMNGLLER